MDDGPAETVGLTPLSACTGETFGGGYRVCPGMAPNPRKRCWSSRQAEPRRMCLMGSVKKGKHVGIWGITSHPFVAST
ncbi:MAG: hypothetical protein CM15mP128_2040 [Methanobacteriota archaeon]|nr:MAG: hypothetical protein CM15mP128_2040 [Euryarchaeota archaeon]